MKQAPNALPARPDNPLVCHSGIGSPWTAIRDQALSHVLIVEVVVVGRTLKPISDLDRGAEDIINHRKARGHFVDVDAAVPAGL